MDLENEKSPAGGWLILGAPVAIVYLAYLVFAESYVCSRLWGWYAVPLGVVALQWRTFFGASLLRSAFLLKAPREEGVDARTKQARRVQQAAHWAAPWIILLLGWWFK